MLQVVDLIDEPLDLALLTVRRFTAELLIYVFMVRLGPGQLSLGFCMAEGLARNKGIIKKN